MNGSGENSENIFHPFDGFCDTPFWNTAVSWNTTEPTLSPCFVDTALTWIPVGFLWLTFPYTIFDYLTSHRPSIAWCWYNRAKLQIAGILALIGVVHAMHVTSIAKGEAPNIGDFSISTAHVLALWLKALTFILLLLYTLVQRWKGFINGAAQWFYLLLHAIVMAIRIVVEYTHRPLNHMFYTYVEFGCIFLLLIFASFPEKVPNLDELLGSSYLYGPLEKASSFAISEDGDQQGGGHSSKPKRRIICPKETTSFPSKLTFWWFDKLIFLGYRRALVLDDLWEIRVPDKCADLFNQFNKYWNHPVFIPKPETEGPGSFIDAVNSNGNQPNGHHHHHHSHHHKHHHHHHRHSHDNGNRRRRSIFSRKSFTFNDGQPKQLRPPEPMEYETPRTNLLKIIFRQFWWYFTWPSVARLCTETLQLVNPLILKFMIGFISNEEPFWHGMLYSVLFVITNIVQSITSAYHQHRMSVFAMRVRSCTLAAIYRKSLVLASSAKKNYTTGEVVNLMAVDSQRFIDMVPWICYLWTAPVMIGVGLWLLWLELGQAVLSGGILTVLFMPICAGVAWEVKRLQTKQMDFKDDRLKAINEMLNGIKVLKLYAWEEAFIERIEQIRKRELRFIRNSGLVSAIFVGISTSSPFLVSCVTFAHYVLLAPDEPLDAQKAFVSIAFFNLLRIPLLMLPNMLVTFVLMLVSVNRINGFLNSDETKDYVMRHVHQTDAITFTNATFSWDTPRKGQQPMEVLRNIHLTLPRGRLVAVVGSVGSGKSSFLYSMLGEMQKLSGQINISGDLRIAFVPQQAWIQNSTVRGNILFGSGYNQRRYDEVVAACSLLSDFSMLPAGDETEIGEKGTNLSGGQKQRISIARACYSDSDVFLFDDPLSAVDSHVGKHIFDEVLSNEQGILKGKTRILATNALYMLPFVDEIILLKKGDIEAMGSYQQLLDQSPYFFELITSYISEGVGEGDKHTEPLETIEEVDDEEIEDLDPEEFARVARRLSHASIKTNRRLSQQITTRLSLTRPSVIEEEIDTEHLEAIAKNSKDKGKLVETETVEEGNISWTVYRKFIQSLSMFWFCSIIIFYFLQVSFNSGSNFWLSVWTSHTNVTWADNRYYLIWYAVIGLLQVALNFCAWNSIILGTLNASKMLHSKLMKSIVHAPMYFFDTNPLGRVMNRFSRDVDTVDANIQFLIRVLLNAALQALETIFIISLQTPLFLTFFIPFLGIYYFIQRFYVATSRQLKRLEAVTRSPILNHFGETILGVPTIKAYGHCERFIAESDHRVDVNQRCFYPSAVANCWLQVRLDFLANCLIFFASLFAVLSKIGVGSVLNASQTGLSLSYALNVTLALNWCVRMFAELENNVVSVERIHEYTDVPPEAPWRLDGDRSVPKDWPQSGAIDFKDYATRYRPGLDLVLKGIDLKIKPGEKIGIVGRTGAGKSSLTLALFRIIEAVHGDIVLDNIQVATLGLHKLRSRLTIIPQDPVVFSGTIRFNLDPFNEYSDEQIWYALEHSHLKPFVCSQPDGLQYMVTEAGENVSVGQRQLVCLARALLRRTNVLILDEATAAVDLGTDNLIQETIRSEFADCTVLTIAHRLHTIMDSDRVMVLDAGKIAEFDAPQTLLASSQSIFYSLAKDAGIVGQ